MSMAFLTQGEIDDLKKSIQSSRNQANSAIFLNAETISDQQTGILRSVKLKMEIALYELSELMPSDPDSFPDGAESHQPEIRQ